MTAWLPSALVAHLWQSTWFAAAVWLAALVLRHHSARLRYWLWAAASLKFLVPFSWLVSLGARFEWRAAPAAARPAAAFVMTEVFAPSRLLAVPDIVTRQTTTVPLVLVSVWLAGTATALFWWWRQWLPVRAAVRAATPVTLLDEPDLAGLPVLQSSLMFEPGVIGVRRPVLLVPAGLVERLTPAQIRALVAHERCHVRCHDNLFAAINMAVEAIFWFHPLVWWIAARQIDERERACDEAVLRAGSEPTDYAEGILTVCRWSLASPVICISGITGSDLRTRIEAIMASRIGRRLNGTGRILLALGAVTMLGGPIGLGLFDVAAQSSNAPAARFDVVAIKRSPEGGSGVTFAPMPGGRLHVVNNPVMNLIQNAYNIPQYRITGAPEWVKEERYDLEAKTEGSPSRAEMMLKLQTLLADRFRLKIHRETKDGPVFILTVPKGGSRLSRFKEGSCVDRSPGAVLAPDEKRPNCGNNLLRQRGQNFAWVATRIDMRGVADVLAIITRRNVIDQTGITGLFDVNVELPPLLPEVGGVSDQPAADSGVSMFTVLREQLGLTLESGKGPVDYLVVDSVARPSEN
jgi:bla regulator protein blaR1